MSIPELLAAVSPDRLRATVERLASFHTRNTLSPGLEEACAWLAEQYRQVPGLRIEEWRYTLPQGPRVPTEREAVQVIATLPGRSDRRIIVSAHIDSLVLGVDPATGRAPGANDDASGVALTLEVARLLSAHPHENTLVFVAFSGEEQGLLGARALAQRAREENWVIDGVLNNDTVGSSGNLLGQEDAARIRVFSEESDRHQSRELARLIEWNGRQLLDGFGAKLVLRKDRFGRGGDHTPFNIEGFTAVRFTETHEEYTRQHTTDDLPENMDFEYLANVTRLNLATAARMADAPAQPTAVKAERAENHSARITWSGSGEVDVFWRDTASAVWQELRRVNGGETLIDRINVDDHIFAVAAPGGIPVVAV